MTFEQTKKIRSLINTSANEGGLISLYVPINYPDGDPELIFQNFWTQAMKLRKDKGLPELKAPVIPWLIFMKQHKAAVAIFISTQGHAIYALDESVPSRLVVATSFHLKPLVAVYSKGYSRKLLNKLLVDGESHKFSVQDDFQTLKQKIKAKEFKSLVVSLEDMLFHEGDQYKKITRTQHSHKDDDALDDLLELAIKERLKVGVVSKNFLPEKICLIAS